MYASTTDLCGATELNLQLPPEVFGLSQEVLHGVEHAVRVGRVLREQRL